MKTPQYSHTHLHHVLVLNLKYCRGPFPKRRGLLALIMLTMGLILVLVLVRKIDYVSITTRKISQLHHLKPSSYNGGQFGMNLFRLSDAVEAETEKTPSALELEITQDPTNIQCERRFENLPNCSGVDQLKETFRYIFTMKLGIPLHEILKEHPDVHGGHWEPANGTCRPVQHVAVIIPYRDRADHLTLLLTNLHGFLKDQSLEYTIMVVEQKVNQSFNRGKLMNVGVLEAQAHASCPIDCFVFHDVDTIPHGPGPHYACQEQPKQLSAYQSKWNYKLPYAKYFGGVVNARAEHLNKMNGFSNIYWGWGGEDDDAYVRLKKLKWTRLKPSGPIGKYENIKHKQFDNGKNAPGECRFKILKKAGKRWKKEGLNSTDYSVIDRRDFDLYKWILVDLLEEKSQKWIKQRKFCI